MAINSRARLLGTFAVGGLLAGWVVGAWAQSMGEMSGVAKAQRAAVVSYAAEPATVPAEKRSVVEVRLRVADGFHINSHRPKGDLLIATSAMVGAGDAGVQVGEVEYPAGTEYRFAIDPADVLDVYTGAVVLRVPVIARAGEHALRGSLRYQACDDRACYPPKTLALVVPFTAK